MCSKEVVRYPKRSVRCSRLFLQLHRPHPHPFIEDKITSRAQTENKDEIICIFKKPCRISPINGNRWDMLCSPGRPVFLAAASVGTPRFHAAAQPWQLLQLLGAAAPACASQAPSSSHPQEPCPIALLITLPHFIQCHYLHQHFQPWCP